MATQENIDLMKGVLITGPIGCGKTAVMRIVRSLCADSNKPVIVSCRSIAEGFMVHGHDILRKYSSNAFYAYTSVPRVHCFDDLGLENVGAFYGNACNVMAEILLSRYDLFISHKMITHVTTNLNSQEIEQSYGNRLRSRMREMFNLIAFPQESPDKRK